MFDERTSVRVGAVVALLLGAAVVVALRFNFHDLGPAIQVRVFLKHPGPLREKADLQLAGRVIGRVDSIRLVSSNEARRPTHILYPDGGVLLQVSVKKKYLRWVRKNGEIFVNTRGLIGDAYLEVSPPPGSSEMGRSIQSGDNLRGIDPARMEHIIVTSFENAQRFGILLKQLEPDLEQLKNETKSLSQNLAALHMQPGSYQEMQASFSSAYLDYQQLRSTFADTDLQPLQQGGQKLLLRIRADVSDLSLRFVSLHEQFVSLRSRIPSGLRSKFAQLSQQTEANMTRLHHMGTQLSQLAEGVALGQGTVGALINDPEFSDDAKKLGRYLKRHPWELIVRPAN